MRNFSDKQYKAKIKVKKIFFPKGASSVPTGEFAIFSAVKVGEDETNFDNYIKLKGNVCQLDFKTEYNVTYKLKDDNKWGKTYEIIYISRNVDTSSIDGQKHFLKIFLSDTIVDELFKTYGDKVKDIIVNEDIESLKKVHGIGEAKALRIIKEFNSHKNYELIYSELQEYKLSPKLVAKLVDHYKSPENVVKIIKEDVYALVEIKGVGFKTADEIALSSGVKSTDHRRIKGFIIYYLQNESETGKSYVVYSELVNALQDTLGHIDIKEINNCANTLVSSGKVMAFNKGKVIALTSMFELERDIFRELMRLNSYTRQVTEYDSQRVERAIQTSEDEQGFAFTDEQRQAIRDSVYHNIIAITGGAGCVDCDTEYFSQNGWKKISSYQHGDLVLQYNDNGTTELVTPLAYIKQPNDTLNYVHNDALNMCLSDNHICYYLNGDNLLQCDTFQNILERHYKSNGNFAGKFICGFNNLGKGLEISDDILRLYTMMIIKGKYMSNDSTSKDYLLYSVKLKELNNYKRKLLIQTLQSLGIKYISRNKLHGFENIMFYAPSRIEEFPNEWYNLNNRQFLVILEVIRNFATLHNHNNVLRDDIHFTTQWFTNKHIADFIQFAIASTGHRGEIIEEPIIDNRYTDTLKSKKYCVSWYNHCTVKFNYNHTDEKLPVSEYQTKDGFEYCFTVPSNKLVLRRKNKIFVTGNCGKTTTANGIFNVFNRNQILACALSGKASVRITEATGLQANTIHKTLGFNGHGFEYTSSHQLKCSCFLIDESTMVNGTLFLQVLKAIPTGATLIMCGDIKQLTPIGNCQVFYDILRYSNVQVIELTKPHRQALKSGIITTSLAISSQQQILGYNDSGIKVFGELQDMVVKIQPDRATIFNDIINTFMAELKTDDIMEIQIIVAVRNRGDVSCYNINTKIQELVNPRKGKNKDQLEITVFSHTVANEKYYYHIRVGDKVINTKNNYECVNASEEVTPVFNGNIGIVKKITYTECIIDFVGIGEVIFSNEDWYNLELAYSLTCHKTQGSGFSKVIVGLDSNSYLMNCSEWLYTAITRAKKKCMLISTNNTVFQTISKKETRKKQTFLGSFFKYKPLT